MMTSESKKHCFWFALKVHLIKKAEFQWEFPMVSRPVTMCPWISSSAITTMFSLTAQIFE